MVLNPIYGPPAEAADDTLIDQAQMQYDLAMTATARASIARITKSYPDAADLALLHAYLGDTSYAEHFLAAHRDQASNTLPGTSYLPQLRAVLSLTQRKPTEAVAALEPARLYGNSSYYV